MQEYTTISVKIPVGDREEMRRLNIRPSKFVRGAIRRRLRAARIERLKASRDRMDALFKKLPAEEVTATIREDRDSR